MFALFSLISLMIFHPVRRSLSVTPYQNVLSLLKVIMTSNALCREMSELEVRCTLKKG